MQPRPRVLSSVIRYHLLTLTAVWCESVIPLISARFGAESVEIYSWQFYPNPAPVVLILIFSNPSTRSFFMALFFHISGGQAQRRGRQRRESCHNRSNLSTRLQSLELYCLIIIRNWAQDCGAYFPELIFTFFHVSVGSCHRGTFLCKGITFLILAIARAVCEEHTGHWSGIRLVISARSAVLLHHAGGPECAMARSVDLQW